MPVGSLSLLIGRRRGTSWEIIGKIAGEGFSNAPMLASMVVGPVGELYVVGEFNLVDGKSAKGVVRWDRVAWEALGKGLHSRTQTSPGLRATWPCGAALWWLVAHLTAGGTKAANLAAWSNSGWQSLSSPFYGGAIQSIVASPDDLLYVSGMDGAYEGLVARFNGKGGK